jgi:segregation and condensation protein B
VEHNELVPVIEAILFAAGFPVKYEKIAQTLEITEDELKNILSSEAFSYENRGIRLVMFSDSCQLCTDELYERQVKTALGMRHGGALSSSSMETLAIIAYNQPATKSFIEQVRGVDSTYAITTLCEKQLIEVVGRLDVPGKPNLYATTETFLRCFGLSSLEELPKTEVLESTAADKSDEQTEIVSQGEEENSNS